MGKPIQGEYADGSWDDAFEDVVKPAEALNSQEPPEEWYQQWDANDDGKAGKLRMKIFWLCAVPGLLQFLCGSLFLPALPDINEQYQPTAFQSTCTLSIYSLFSGIVPIFWGPISDRYSRKWLLVGNLLLYAILNYINAWNRTMNGIILLRSLIAIPLASFFVVVTGIMTDIFREKERAFWLGIRNLPGFMSVLLAPPIGGVMVYLGGWRSTAYAQALLGVFAMLLILYMLPETLNKERAKNASLNPLGPVLIMLKPRILPNALVQGIGFSAMYLTIAAIPLTFPEYYGANNITIGLSLVPFAVGSALGAACGGLSTLRLKKYLGLSGTVVSALFWNTLCLPAFIGWGYTLKYNIWLPIFFTALVGFLRNATTPPTLMFCLAEVPNQSAAVNAGLLAVQFVFGAIVVAVAPSLVANHGVEWGTIMLWLSGIEFICLLPIAWMVYTTYRRTKREGLLQNDETQPLTAPSGYSTNALSGAQREFRESSIGYISDSTEFLR